MVFANADASGRFIRQPCSPVFEYDVEEARALGPPVVVAPPIEPPGLSCPECAELLPPREALAASDAVLQGWSVDLEHIGEGSSGRRRATFEVVRWWKGGTEPVVALDIPRGYWECLEQEIGLNVRHPSGGYIDQCPTDRGSADVHSRWARHRHTSPDADGESATAAGANRTTGSGVADISS